MYIQSNQSLRKGFNYCNVYCRSITDNATLLPQLDFQMVLVAYIDYFHILSLKFDVASTADACIHMLLQKAPYLTAFEKNDTLYQNIFEFFENNLRPQ